MSQRFSGRTVLITGAAQGMGRAAAQRFLGEGANVVLFDLDGDLAEQVAAEAGTPDTTAVIPGDVSLRADIRSAVAAAVSRFGQLDVLVSHAGVGDLRPLLEIDDAAWQRMLAVNLTGAFFSVQEAAKAMGSNGGAIVVTASTNAFHVEEHTAHYSATKGGIRTFVRAAAMDLGRYGIRVNAILPGIIRTRSAAALTEDPVAGPEYLKHVPLNRFGEPAEIAEGILFLASDQASYITGADLVVDGGATLGIALGIPDKPFPGFDA